METSEARTRSLGRSSGTRLEVVYNDTGSGYEAVFQETNGNRLSRPSPGAAGGNQSSISLAQWQTSFLADPTRTVTIASGIHPDRTELVPQSPRTRRRSSPPPLPTPQKLHADAGIGFKGLNDLFDSTKAKPKL